MGGKTLQGLCYVGDLSVQDINVVKINKFLEVFRVQGARLDLKIRLKKIKPLKIGINEE